MSDRVPEFDASKYTDAASLKEAKKERKDAHSKALKDWIERCQEEGQALKLVKKEADNQTVLDEGMPTLVATGIAPTRRRCRAVRRRTRPAGTDAPGSTVPVEQVLPIVKHNAKKDHVLLAWSTGVELWQVERTARTAHLMRRTPHASPPRHCSLGPLRRKSARKSTG